MLLATGCRQILGIEETTLAEGGSAGAGGADCRTGDAGAPTGNGIGWWSGCDESNDCFSAKVPRPEDRPSNVEPGEDVPRLFLAFTSLRLGARNLDGELDPQAWQQTGFDLDGRCTQSSSCPMLGDPPVACLPFGSETPDDGGYCRDNQIGRLDYMLDTLPETSGRFMATDAELNCSLCRGEYNMVFAVSSYNGLPDDDSVRVDLYPSPGIADPKPIDCGQPSWDTSACWTREDAWSVRRSHVPSDEPGPDIGPATYYDPAAYVRDGVLVASLPENTPLWFPQRGGSARVLPVILQGGLLVGRLTGESDNWALSDGVLGGRTRKADLVAAFGRLGLCEDDPAFPLIKTFTDNAADVLSNGAVLPDTPCDALSLGFAFTASEATVGPLVDVEDPVGCEAGAGGAGG